MDEMRAQFPNIETAEIDVLSRLYGRLLPDMMRADITELEALKDDVLAARIAFAVSDEMAMHVSDVVMRRLVEGQLGLLSVAQIDVIANFMAQKIGWSEAELKRQKAALSALMKNTETA